MTTIKGNIQPIEYEKKINELDKKDEQLYDQIVTDDVDYSIFISQYEDSYIENKDITGVLLTYNKISLDIISSVSEKCISYEKKLIEINNNIINLKNNLLK